MPDLTTLSRGTLIMLGAGVLLLIDSFLAWQKVTIDIAGVTAAEATQTLWDSGAGVIAGLALIALLVWIGLRIANVDVKLNVPERLVVGGLAGLVFVLVLLKNLLDDFSAWPSYVGVVLAGLVLVGAWLHLQEPDVAAADTAPAEPPPVAPPPPSSESGV